MHERKALMAELSDGFIAMPGGFGTFEEFCEILTPRSQLGLHRKPVGLLNVADYYAPLLALFDQGVREGFVLKENREMVLSATAPQPLLKRLREHVPPAAPRWIRTTAET